MLQGFLVGPFSFLLTPFPSLLRKASSSPPEIEGATTLVCATIVCYGFVFDDYGLVRLGFHRYDFFGVYQMEKSADVHLNGGSLKIGAIDDLRTDSNPNNEHIMEGYYHGAMGIQIFGRSKYLISLVVAAISLKLLDVKSEQTVEMTTWMLKLVLVGKFNFSTSQGVVGLVEVLTKESSQGEAKD